MYREVEDARVKGLKATPAVGDDVTAARNREHSRYTHQGCEREGYSHRGVCERDGAQTRLSAKSSKVRVSAYIFFFLSFLALIFPSFNTPNVRPLRFREEEKRNRHVVYFPPPPDGQTAATYLFLLHSPHLPSNHAALYIPVPASVAPDPAHVCAALASPPRRSHFQFSSSAPTIRERRDQGPTRDGPARSP
ncbi:hypothetical protein EVAR_48998_1 [Eumeta japonica]|uniref:Transmembrane protein n=1 Tax=Eumeta variegata TaxID=151549 RepID=A0A4C1Z2T2_EUMVA|nr:hypothetical protein EVAR_48998_1 [Eumeta japonica]